MPDDPPPKRRGRPRRYDPEVLGRLAQEAADRSLWDGGTRRSPKAQQDDYWERRARFVIADWKRQGMPLPEGVDPSLEWWEERPRRSAWAELGRLNDATRIISLALWINAQRPAGTREAREWLRDYRRTMEAVDKGRDEVRIRGRVFYPEKLARLAGYLPATPSADSPDG